MISSAISTNLVEIVLTTSNSAINTSEKDLNLMEWGGDCFIKHPERKRIWVIKMGEERRGEFQIAYSSYLICHNIGTGGEEEKSGDFPFQIDSVKTKLALLIKRALCSNQLLFIHQYLSRTRR